MRTYVRSTLAAGLMLTSVLNLAQAQTGDLFLHGSFENFNTAPRNDSEAARFLTQATFGPTRAEIARLRQIGYSAWINEQLAMTPSLTRPFLNTLEQNPSFSLNSGHRVDRWAVLATTAPDQLRQRMAFALSQILVVSDAGGIDTRQIAE